MKQRVMIRRKGKYLMALLPVCLTLGVWGIAMLLVEQLDCQGGLKHLKPCYLAGIDITSFLGLGLFWAPLLSVVTGPVSFAFLGKAIIDDVRQRRQVAQ